MIGAIEPANYLASRRLAFRKGSTMLRWAVLFLIIALIAAVLGFGGIQGLAMQIARILFFLFLVLFVISLVMGRRGPPVP
jgi:uncharacterized membrane protein YtjA (UPF0391 family)